MAEYKIGMVALTRGAALSRGIDELRLALPDATITAPDETGIFEVAIEADSFENALERVWNGVAAGGADDDIAFAEHPEIPEHWRYRVATPNQAD